jgi:pimeloyl-ACP methyl ester carboxylesterase
LVDDLAEITKYLLITFGKEKAFLTGVSWGASLALLTAHRSPELFYAVSVRGTTVSQKVSDLKATNILLEKLKQAGEKKEYIRLMEVATPTLKDFHAFEYQRSLMNKFGMIFTHCRTKSCSQYSLFGT